MHRDAGPGDHPAVDGVLDVLGVGLVAVRLRQELAHQLTGGELLDLVHDVAALPAHTPAAHVEDLHGGLELVLGEGHHVGVGPVGQHHGLLLRRPPQRADVIAQPGRLLVVLVCGRLGHLALEPADELHRVAGHEVAEVVDDRAVGLLVDPADAGRRALVDVAQQAGPPDLPGPDEHALGAGAGREHPQQQVERLADGPGMGVRPEVAHALALGAAHHLQPREVLVQRDGQARVALVVAVLDVEAGVVLLDPGVLQLQRLDLGADHGPLHGGGRGDHLAGAGVQRPGVLEVARQPAAQALGLADVDDPTGRVAEPVHARSDRDRPRRRTVRRRVCHAVSLRP